MLKKQMKEKLNERILKLKRELKKEKLREKGITLIALVVTIIILLILAGVTLSMALSENGLFRRAKEGTERYKTAQTNEEEQIAELDKYIENIGKEDENAKFENNGIDKTHDGAKYDPITTDDGMWIVYKDIDTKTTKVNVYVESKYYCPSFEQFVFEKYCLAGVLNNYALPVYSFSDLSDFWTQFLLNLMSGEGGGLEFNELNIDKRKEDMKVGVFFEELLDKVGVDAYETYREAGNEVISLLISGRMGEISSDNMGLALALGGTRMMIYEPNITYENLEATYNSLYGDRKNLKIPDEENGNNYKITLPDGKEEEINGKDLYKAKFRYVTTKNDSVNIEITKNEETPQKITYDKVNNIDGCIFKEEEYTYTYNCLPYIDCVSLYGTFDLKELMMSEVISTEELEERILKYRFNLGGWNVTESNLLKRLYEAGSTAYIWDPSKAEVGTFGKIKDTCKSELNGEPVTCMVGTYLGRTIKNENALNLIPNTVKYMFDTFRRASFSDDMMEITLPKSVEYGSYVMGPLRQNFVELHFPKFKLHESSKTGCFEFGDKWNVDELISEGIVEIYK